jgi:hypothetical protein
MSGLDSIAMAVALLEQRRECQQPPESPTLPISLPARAPLAKIISTDHGLDTMSTLSRVIPKAVAIPMVHPTSISNFTDATLFDQNYLFAYVFALDLTELATISVPAPHEEILTPNENDILCGRGGETNNFRLVLCCGIHHVAVSSVCCLLPWHACIGSTGPCKHRWE